MSKLLNNEGKNKINRTYDLFTDSVKNLNKLISDKTLDEYNEFLTMLKGRKNSFDKAVAEAIDSVYVKGILDEDDIVTGCPTDIVKFNKDYKTSKTKELLEGGTEKMEKKNIIEESVKNNKTNIKLSKNNNDETYRDFIIGQVDIMKSIMNKLLDEFVDEVKNTDNSTLNTRVSSSLLTSMKEKFPVFLEEAIRETSLDEMVEPFKQLMEVKQEELEDASKIVIEPFTNLSYFIASTLCKDIGNQPIILEPTVIRIGDEEITGEIAESVYDAILHLLQPEQQEQIEEEDESEQPKVKVSYKITKMKDKIKLTIGNKFYYINEGKNETDTAIDVIKVILEHVDLSDIYAYEVLSNYTPDLITDIVSGYISNSDLSKLMFKPKDLVTNANSLIK